MRLLLETLTSNISLIPNNLLLSLTRTPSVTQFYQLFNSPLQPVKVLMRSTSSSKTSPQTSTINKIMLMPLTPTTKQLVRHYKTNSRLPSHITQSRSSPLPNNVMIPLRPSVKPKLKSVKLLEILNRTKTLLKVRPPWELSRTQFS